MLLLEAEVSLADFIVALEEEEIQELSNLFDPCGNVTDATKIQYALDRAHEELNSYFVVGGNCTKALIKLSAKNIIIAIARHLLDTVKARPHVTEDYDKAMEKLKTFAQYDNEYNCPLSDEDLAEILGEPPPLVDKNFRSSTSGRCWIPGDFSDHQRRLFDRRSRGSTRRADRSVHWSDDIPE